MLTLEHALGSTESDQTACVGPEWDRCARFILFGRPFRVRTNKGLMSKPEALAEEFKKHFESKKTPGYHKDGCIAAGTGATTEAK